MTYCFTEDLSARLADETAQVAAELGLSSDELMRLAIAALEGVSAIPLKGPEAAFLAQVARRDRGGEPAAVETRTVCDSGSVTAALLRAGMLSLCPPPPSVDRVAHFGLRPTPLGRAWLAANTRRKEVADAP